MVRERSFLKAFQPLSRKLSAVLREKIDYAGVPEIPPPRLVINTRTADLRQDLTKNGPAIQT
jgi:hypothetical protein